jgi:hypothetical protein
MCNFCENKISDFIWLPRLMVVCLHGLNHGCFLIIGFKG